MHKLEMFSPLNNSEISKYPTSPYVYLTVGAHITTENGVILLSPQLMSAKEIDVTIEQYKNELDEFGKKAKKEIELLKAKMLKK